MSQLSVEDLKDAPSEKKNEFTCKVVTNVQEKIQVKFKAQPPQKLLNDDRKSQGSVIASSGSMLSLAGG